MQRTTQGTVPDTDTDTYTEADINTNKDEDEDTTSIILEHVRLSVCVCNFLYGLLRFLKTSDVITQSETSIDSSPSKAISRQN